MVEQSGEPLLLSFLCCFPHTVQPLGHAFSRSVSGACAAERCSPSSVPFPPQPPQKVALPCSAGSQVLRHSPTSPARTCPPFGLWPSRTALHPHTKPPSRSPRSHHCCSSSSPGSQPT